LPIALNEFGIPVKGRYRNEDLAKILSVHPTTIQWRCDRSKYGEIKKDAEGRIEQRERLAGLLNYYYRAA
jgi:hypothetical protein